MQPLHISWRATGDSRVIAVRPNFWPPVIIATKLVPSLNRPIEFPMKVDLKFLMAEMLKLTEQQKLFENETFPI